MTTDEAWQLLREIVEDADFDLSFGYSQRIIAYHELGDNTHSLENVLAVREAVFADPEADIEAAASRLAGCFRHESCDGSILSALVVFNAGSDRRKDPEWMARWAGNVAAYEDALEWAEQYRGDESMDKAKISFALGVVWGVAQLLKAIKSPYGQELEDAVVYIKQEVGLE